MSKRRTKFTEAETHREKRCDASEDHTRWWVRLENRYQSANLEQMTMTFLRLTKLRVPPIVDENV